MLAKKMPLSESSSTFDSFKNPPADIYMKFYFFNLTNAEDVMVNGSKPQFTEIGPYSYKNMRVKSNIEFSSDGVEISYDEAKFYEFDREASAGSDEDTFINLDLVAYKITKQAYDKGSAPLLLKTLVRLGREKPFTEYVVKDFLFGAEDKLIKKATKLAGVEVPHNVFGILIDKATGESMNGSIAGNYTLNTGVANLADYQQVIAYNGMKRLNDVWPVNITDPTTGEVVDPNVIRGTLGTGFAPFVKEDSILTAFAADLCAAIDFKFNTTSQVGPLATKRFMIDVENWRKYVGDMNRAMCDEEDRNDPIKCVQDGILNATNCKGAALMMSLPHFMDADPFYQGLVEGLEPNREKHSIYLDIDPVTGAAVDVAKRMQINVRLFRMDFKNYDQLPEYTLMPIMWLEESGGVRPDGLERLKAKVHDKFSMLKNGGYIVLIVGIALLPIGIIVFLIAKQKCIKRNNNRAYQMNVYGNGMEKEPFRAWETLRSIVVSLSLSTLITSFVVYYRF